MITKLDTLSWSNDLLSGNAEFVETTNAIYVVSQLRTDSQGNQTFVVLKSNPSPPDPGPGYSFTDMVTYTFTTPTKSFDPVACISGTNLHILGAVDNGSGGVNLLKFTYDITQEGTANPLLSAPTTVISGTYIRNAYDICALSTGHTFVSVAVTNTTTFPNQHVLLGIELDTTNATVSTQQLDVSTMRGGNTFNAVSLATPDGVVIETYYESFPKSITYADITYSVRRITRDSSGTWGSSIELTNFVGRMADDRLTVITDGEKRFVSQVFYQQLIHQDALIGNVLLGYYDGTKWFTPTQTNKWPIIPGSLAGGSFVQATLSVPQNGTPYMAYIAEPAYTLRGAWEGNLQYAAGDRVTYYSNWVLDAAGNKVHFTGKVGDFIANLPVPSTLNIPPNIDTVSWSPAPTSWPMRVASINTSDPDLAITDIPGFYNQLQFTWLRGSKSIVDNKTKWSLIGEKVNSDATVATSYVSAFNVPPSASLTSTPIGANTYRGVTRYFDASGTLEADGGSVTYAWSNDSVDALNSNLVEFSSAGSSATLFVPYEIGGAAAPFSVAVVAYDVNNPPMNVTGVAVLNNTIIATTDAPVNLSVNENVLLYGLNFPGINVRPLTVTSVSQNQFSGTITGFTSPNTPTIPQTGYAVAPPQYAVYDVVVPQNAAPTIAPMADISAARNSTVTIAPTFTGLGDVDDNITYTWQQTSGTPVSITGASTATLSVNTQGVNTGGETLVFQITVSDGVNPSVSASVNVIVPAYSYLGMDTQRIQRSMWSGSISQRNSSQTWGTLTPSTLYSNVIKVKRNSGSDGYDREIWISPYSVTVFNPLSPSMLVLRKLLSPDNTTILDAVQTELDYTLVLDAKQRLSRYKGQVVITTDSPDIVLDLTSLTTQTFKTVYATVQHDNSRIIAVCGDSGGLLLQVKDSDLTVLGSMELTEEDGFLYGADNIQWIRTSNVETLKTGRVLVGSISTLTSNITQISITNNLLTVTGANAFSANQAVTFRGMGAAGSFLEGITVSLLSATGSAFSASFSHADLAATITTGTAVSPSKSYETLIDLSRKRVVGTWDATNLRNQYVTTGEILFEPTSSYSGVPSAPTLNTVVEQPGGQYLISWTQTRPDLVSSYLVESQTSTDGATWLTWLIFAQSRSGYSTSITTSLTTGFKYRFRVRAISSDGVSPYSNIQSISIM